MLPLNQYTFVCEFRIKLGNQLNQNHVDFLNNTKDVDSTANGKFTVSECDSDKDTLTGRYYLKSDVIAYSDFDYHQTMRTDLILLIKRDLNFPMDGIPEIERATTVHAVILPELDLIHNGNGDQKLYHSQRTNLFYILNDDGYCDGSFYNEEQALHALMNGDF